LRKARWNKAFSGELKGGTKSYNDLRATIVIEHIIQASDGEFDYVTKVAHLPSFFLRLTQIKFLTPCSTGMFTESGMQGSSKRCICVSFSLLTKSECCCWYYYSHALTIYPTSFQHSNKDGWLLTHPHSGIKGKLVSLE
jgi:hypothetical protein